MKSYHYLWLILITYFVIGISYLLLNPLWEAPDEIHHYPMVQYLQTHNLTLPSQAEGTVGLWQQEGNQPPLYYILGAILTSMIDTSDIDDVMRVNPHADIGIIRPDGNVNRLVHHPDNESFPSSEAVLATYMLRFFSLILGIGTVYVSYLTAKLLFPDSSEIPLLSAGINAFIPMFIYISASVNNDNLSNLLANLLVFILIYVLLDEKKPSLKNYIVIGIVTGAGLLSKLNIGLLIPLVAISLFIISLRHSDWKPLVIGGFISGGLTILFAGWWYWRNFQLYGDPTALDRFLEIVGRRAEPATLAQLWTERDSFVMTFWGLFGSINVPMPPMLYSAFNWLGGLALFSGIIVFFKKIIGDKNRRLATALPIIWTLTVLIAVMRWSSITPASQGRLIYGAISSICLIMAGGLLYWIPQKMQKWVVVMVVCSMAVIAGLQPFMTIAPAYAKPNDLAICAEECPATDLVFFSSDGEIAMYDIRVLTSQVTTGSYIQFEADFAVLETFESDWSIFVHVVSPEGIILAQRDVYPAQGLLATSDVVKNYSWRNLFAVYIPETTFAPTTVDVRLGWYNLNTGERMRLADGSDTVTIGEIMITSSEFSYNFGNEIELIGYDISDLSAEAGETIELTLHWRRLRAIETDYVVFANIIDPASLTKFADSNAMPAEWTRPTSTWAEGEIIEDTHILTIAQDAVAGDYELEIGLYLQEESFPRLPLIGTYDNFLYLTPIRIESEQ